MWSDLRLKVDKDELVNTYLYHNINIIKLLIML